MLEMQEQMNSMNDSCEFLAVESNHSGRSSYVHSEPAAIPSSCFHAEPRQTLATWHMEYAWTTGKRVWSPMFHSWFVPKSLSKNSSFCDTKWHKIGSSADWYKKSCGGYSTEFYGWIAKTADIGTAIRQIPYTFKNFFVGR